MNRKQGPRPVVHKASPNYNDEKLPPGWDYDRLVAQGFKDSKTPWLWVGRESFLDTLVNKHLAWHIAGTLIEDGLIGMYHIIEVNNDLRAKREKREKEEKAARLQVVVPPPAPPATSPPAAPTTVSAAGDPLIPAVFVARAFGFKNGTILNSLRAQFTDAPQPVAEEGRTVGLYRLSEWQAFDARHPGEIARRLQKAQRASTTHAKRVRAVDDEKDARIAALEAENARLKGHPTAS